MKSQNVLKAIKIFALIDNFYKFLLGFSKESNEVFKGSTKLDEAFLKNS
jgi:hypothetical protein